MAKRTQWLLLIVAVCLALMAALLVQEKLRQATQKPKIAMTSIVVATHRLYAHQMISSTDVQVKQVAASAAPAGVETSLSRIVGSLTAGDWFPGEPVLTSMVATKQEAAGFSLDIPSGYRAFTIPDDPVLGVDHLISPGDHVDVLVSYAGGSSSGKSGSQGKKQVLTVLQNVLVLYVDNTPAPGETVTVKSGSGSSGASSSGSKRTQSADTLTVALTPEQAQKLDFARSNGQIQLLLRNPTDTVTPAIPATTGLP